MFAGRIVFGLGGESLSVAQVRLFARAQCLVLHIIFLLAVPSAYAQSAIIAIWFSGKELALGMSISDAWLLWQ